MIATILRAIRVIVFAYFPAFWLWPYVWDEKCLMAVREVFIAYGRRRQNFR